MDWANHGYLITITVRSFSIPQGCKFKFECGIYELRPLLSWHRGSIYSLERFTSMSFPHTGLITQLALFLNNAVSFRTEHPVGLIFASPASK